jgi:hypothetical protein
MAKPRVTGMRAVLAVAALTLPCSAPCAELVAQWNEIALDTVVTSERRVGHAARAMARVHVAMFEVMCFVEGSYAPRYLVKPPAPLGGSGEAVAAVAAHYVLSELYPLRRSRLDAALRASLAALDPQEQSNARIWGRQLAAAVQVARSREDGVPPSADSPAAIARLAALNRNLASLSDASRLKPIERARAHALASTALGDLYAGLAP